MMKCLFGASSDMRNGAFVATKGKLVATQTITKSIVTTDSHRFKQFVTHVNDQQCNLSMFHQVSLKNLYWYVIFVVPEDTFDQDVISC